MKIITIPEQYSSDGKPIKLSFCVCVEPIVKDCRPYYRCYYECREIRDGILSGVLFSSLGKDFYSYTSLNYIVDSLFKKAEKTVLKYYRDKKLRWSCIDAEIDK